MNKGLWRCHHGIAIIGVHLVYLKMYKREREGTIKTYDKQNNKKYTTNKTPNKHNEIKHEQYLTFCFQLYTDF